MFEIYIERITNLMNQIQRSKYISKLSFSVVREKYRIGEFSNISFADFPVMEIKLN